MGVPKFYRWLSERYPCLSEVVKEHQIPEFDNFYLDMNGIIHICSHPNDDDPHFRITEEQIFSNIFHYIEVLFRMIQPRKVFFLAVDGVAPRAKMNQQRGRRFRSAKEAEMNEKKAKDRGEELPKEARFDSNCITPGTPFMVRLHSQLQYFITNKISTDPLWRQVRVILSGHQTPGEGEHKIMDFIRYEKAQPGYDPNIRHCLYGLDADLMMLGMCSHDPHFSLLREEVRFGGKKNASSRRTVTPEETTFHLLHLSLLREYLDHEFSDLRATLPFEYDMEHIIDDWILLGFLVGNDFLPHLPHLHINKGALHELYSSYKKCLPTLGGYLNVHGTLHLKRFETFMKVLAEKELERFDDIYSDSKWLEGKTAKKNATGKHTIQSTPGPGNVFDLLGGDVSGEPKSKPSPSNKDSALAKLLNSAAEFMDDDDEDSDPDSSTMPKDSTDGFDPSIESSDSRGSIYHMEFRQHKREYYINKLGYTKVDEDVLKEQALCYVRAIQWNLHYYYNGCMSWSWYYPHHFAPWITDIRDFADMEMTFDMSKPFQPFEQLLAVLPAASKELLPEVLQTLMVNPSSPIIDYFPKDFDCDLNGKQQEWEAVVLIPFIDEKRLLNAMEPLIKYLKPDEAARNSHGPINVYQYTPKSLGEYESPAFFPRVSINYAKRTDIDREDWLVEISKLKKGLMEGVRLDVFFPGFPTLKHLPHTACLKSAAVRVFEQASRGENTILTLDVRDDRTAMEVAGMFLNEEVWVGWPHMTEAKVCSVSDDKTIHYVKPNGQVMMKQANAESITKLTLTKKTIAERYKSRWGIDIKQTKVVIEALPMTGRKYVYGREGKITLEKQWAQSPQSFALHTVLKNILVHDPSFTQYRTLDELFPPQSSVFMLGQPKYGCLGTVQEVMSKTGRIRVCFRDVQEPDLRQVHAMQKSNSPKYANGYRTAQFVGLNSHILSRITGTLFVIKGPRGADPDRASKHNMGLCLKFNKRNEEIGGYTKRDEENNWLYSSKVVDILYEYIEKFPEVFDYLFSKTNSSKDVHHVEDIFASRPDVDPLERLNELLAWLKDLPSSNAPRQPCGTLTVEEDVVKKIEETVAHVVDLEPIEEVVVSVKPVSIYKPNLSQGNSLPDKRVVFRLLDRVINVREGFSVPLGLRGTIIGMQNVEKAAEAVLDVLFDKSFPGGMAIRSSPGRSYRVPGSSVINLTFGERDQPGSSATTTTYVKSSTQVVQPKGQNRPVQESYGTPPPPSQLPNPHLFFQSKKTQPTAPIPPPPPPSSLSSLDQIWSGMARGETHPPPLMAFQQPPPIYYPLEQQLNQQMLAMSMGNGHALPPPNSNAFPPPPRVALGGPVRGARPPFTKIDARFVPTQVHQRQRAKAPLPREVLTQSSDDTLPVSTLKKVSPRVEEWVQESVASSVSSNNGVGRGRGRSSTRGANRGDRKSVV